MQAHKCNVRSKLKCSLVEFHPAAVVAVEKRNPALLAVSYPVADSIDKAICNLASLDVSAVALPRKPPRETASQP